MRSLSGPNPRATSRGAAVVAEPPENVARLLLQRLGRLDADLVEAVRANGESEDGPQPDQDRRHADDGDPRPEPGGLAGLGDDLRGRGLPRLEGGGEGIAPRQAAATASAERGRREESGSRQARMACSTAGSRSLTWDEGRSGVASPRSRRAATVRDSNARFPVKIS